MYTLDYLNCFIENLDLPEASRASLRENCETLVTTPGAIDELVSAETLLFKDYGIDGAYGAEWKPIVPHMDAFWSQQGCTATWWISCSLRLQANVCAKITERRA